MARVVITRRLESEINRRFRGDSVKVFELLYGLRDNPKKGKSLGNVGAIVIKELKYGKYRFYFVADGHKIKYLQGEELTDLLVTFVRMSEKKNQQKVIHEIKIVLRNLGNEGFG